MDVNENLLEEKLVRVESARNWSPRVISRLETTIRSADDYDLFRINPIRYAKDKNIDEGESIDLFLHTAKYGLFEMEWHLVCAFCAHVVESLTELSNLHSHFNCDFCKAENDVTMDDYIHISFTVSPQIRTISYHQPTTLSVEDFCYRYHFSRGILPLPNGLTFEQIGAMITRYMDYVFPGETKKIEADVAPGMLQAKDMNNRSGVVFFMDESQQDLQTIPIHLEDGKLQAKNRTLTAATVEQPAATFQYDQTDQLSSGKVHVEYTNLMNEKSLFWLMHYPEGFQASHLQFEPFLSGKRLLTTQTFRNLFRTETLQADEGIAVKDITFLFTDLKGSTDLYDRIGDLKAYYLVRQHFDTLITSITQNSGCIVKTIGDAIMATFMNPVDAVQAALDMIHGLNQFNRTISEDLFLKVGIHRGPSVVVTLNDNLDYFGQTVNIAARVQGLAGANEIYLTRDVHTYKGVTDLLDIHDVLDEKADLKGVRGKIDVCKISINV